MIKVRPTLYWRLMCLWARFFIGPKDKLQCGSFFYGGALHLAFYFERPGKRKVIAQTALTKDHAKHYYAELTKQMDRLEAFGPK